MLQRAFYFLILSVLLALPSCYVGRAIFWNLADVGDMNKFKSRPVVHGDEIFHFHHRAGEVIPRLPADLTLKEYASFDEFMTASQTAGLLIIRNDTVMFERYYYGLDTVALHPAFSAAKSFVSALVGIAIEEGKIGSVNDPITLYLPELRNPGMEKIKIDDLLQMRTGMAFKENFLNPFGIVAKYYYGRNTARLLRKIRAEKEPGTEFRYLSVATQLLGIIIERTTGMKLEKYLQEKIWIPLGMESDATWNIDSRRHGMIKAYCCLNATARDFAKFGRLYLNLGNWNGKQIVPRAWVERSIKPCIPGQKHYSTHWWLTGDECFAAIGHLGQYIFADPATHTIMVRLGIKRGEVNWGKIFSYISKNYK